MSFFSLFVSNYLIKLYTLWNEKEQTFNNYYFINKVSIKKSKSYNLTEKAVFYFMLYN